VSQETLADMIGTTRSRVSHFMNKFRQLGYVDYNGNLEVHSSFIGCCSARKAANKDAKVSNFDHKKSCALSILTNRPGLPFVNLRSATRDYVRCCTSSSPNASTLPKPLRQ